VSVDDLRRLYADLSLKTREALDRHLATLQPPPEGDREQFERLKAEALREGTLTITVRGRDGEQIIAPSEEGLAAGRLPDKLDWVVFDSAASMQLYNVTPLNRFSLRLDFTEPPGFHAYNPWDDPTPNTSQLEVIGNDATWVTGVYESTLAFFRKRKRHRAWLHTQEAFNALNWLIGFPAAFWIVYRVDALLPRVATLHGALRGAIYVYVFLLALLLFRGIVWGFRWLFPVVELEGASSKRLRGLVGAFLSSLLLALVYDVLKALLT
jgi:hypothetical protein